ncbi:HAD family hydrolase, partial [Enterobacter hormaechei]|uniref:HAD family hydrolase n=1 Tax=Enterobacter hormaechei TaxID=158836 RepID=UPI000B2715FE
AGVQDMPEACSLDNLQPLPGEFGGKDAAVHWLVDQYRLHEGSEPTTLGLGDGPNDAPLLDSVGFAVVVKGFNREGVSLKNNDPARVYHTQHTGPTGWCEGLDYFLT